MDSRQQTGGVGSGSLQPPGQLPGSGAEARGGRHWIWLTLGALLLLALAVLFVLPDMVAGLQAPEVAEPGESSVPTGQVVQQPQTAPPPGSQAAQEEARQTLQAFLQLRARLELENAAAWGEPDWSAAAERTSSGDHKFAQRQFAAAGRDYRAALDQLRQLEPRRAENLAAALAQGSAALTANDIDAAVRAFEKALLIEPEHPTATQGLVQAHSRRASMDQMEHARTAEVEDELEEALAAYRQAVQLDPTHKPAGEAVQRVTALIEQRAFAAAMTRVLAALDAGRMNEADVALNEAARLRPADTAVQDARQRLQGMRARAGLNSLRRQAAARAGREDWQSAVVLYRKALAIDPGVAFARIGLSKAQARVKLHAQFDHYLEKPARLYSSQPLANARQLLLATSEPPTGEPRLAAKTSSLRELVALASTPLQLTLKSDGVTNVVVYHVGRIGQFESHQLELLPGDYTVVGSRPGYRDVRKVISLRPGARPPPLLVRCEEAI